MKKKALIILPIIIVACIIILVIPKHNNNVIEETPQETVETSSTPKAPETTPPQENKTVAETTQQKTNNNEVTATTTTEETTVDDGVNSTHTDIELGEGEYKGDSGIDALNADYDSLSPEKKAEVDAALQRAKEKHPELFTDDSTGTPSKAPGYVSVDAPVDNGELPPSTFGQGDYSEGAGAQVY